MKDCDDKFVFLPFTLFRLTCTRLEMFLPQEPADLSKQFPDLAEDFHVPQFFAPDQFFSSVFRISSCGLQLWTHYDVSDLRLVFFVQIRLFVSLNEM